MSCFFSMKIITILSEMYNREARNKNKRGLWKSQNYVQILYTDKQLKTFTMHLIFETLNFKTPL